MKLLKGPLSKTKKLMVAFPATFAIVAVLMFLMFTMSPVVDEVFIKSASAEFLSTFDRNSYVSRIDFYGCNMEGADEALLFHFTANVYSGGTTGGESNFYKDMSEIRVNGNITKVKFTFTVNDAWYSAHSYNATLWRFLNTTMVYTTVSYSGMSDPPVIGYSPVVDDWESYEYTGYSGTKNAPVLYCNLTTPITFTQSGTWAVSYDLYHYY